MPLWFPRAKLVVVAGGPAHQSQRCPCPRPRRCVNLQIKAVQEQLDRDPLEHLFLMMEIDNRLLEVEEKFASIGHKEKCVDIQLERARMKRWGDPLCSLPRGSAQMQPPAQPRARERRSASRSGVDMHTFSHSTAQVTPQGPGAAHPQQCGHLPDRSHHLPIPAPPPTQGHPTVGSMQGFKTQPANQRPGITSSLYEGKATRCLGAPS